MLAVAATALGRLPADQVPAPLRAAARFTPSKRVRLAGPALAAALSTDAIFRLRAAEQIERESPDMAEAARTGVLPGAADPVELAAAAYLLRPAGWTELVERSRAALEERNHPHPRPSPRRRGGASCGPSWPTRTPPSASRPSGSAPRPRPPGPRRTPCAGNCASRPAPAARPSGPAPPPRRRWPRSAGASPPRTPAARPSCAGSGSGWPRPSDAVEAGRRAARETRQADEARLWLLLDTLTGAAQGLRRELALTPTDERPADSVAASQPRPDARAARGDDPELVDRLLGLPRVHLVVDGYNVTKSGYGELPLARSGPG